jgi:hypothetical protein
VQLFGERPAHVCGSSQVAPEMVHGTAEVMCCRPAPGVIGLSWRLRC